LPGFRVWAEWGHEQKETEKEITKTQKKLNEAIALAAYIHRLQVRKLPDGRPYICHVLDVVNGLPEKKHLERLIAALHDTVEDVALEDDHIDTANQERKALKQMILGTFGHEVLAGVEAMTHLKKKGLSEKAELAHYLSYVRNNVAANKAAVAVKIVDNYVNMKDRVTQFVAGGKDAEKAREKLHQYACSIALLTEKKEKTAK
jgi:hypothetical protein